MNILPRLIGAATLCLAASTLHAQTMYVSNWLPVGHPILGVMQEWAGQVREQTEGRVDLQALPQPVTNPAGHYNAVRDGLADVAMAVIGYTPGRFPLSEIAEMPLMADSAEANSVAFQQMAQNNPAIMDEYRDVKVLALFSHGPGVVFNRQKPIDTLDDLRSLKFRVGGGVVNDVARQLDTNTALKPATETYELLSTGVMDGSWLPFESLVTYKLDNVIKYATVFPGGLYNSTFIVVMNKKRYASLSDADRQVIDQLSGVSYSRALGQAFDARDAEGRQAAEAAGVAVSQAPAALVEEVRQRIEPLQQRWIELARKKGISDPEAVIAQYRAEALAQ